MLDPADIYFSDFVEFKICITQLHGEAGGGGVYLGSAGHGQSKVYGLLT